MIKIQKERFTCPAEIKPSRSHFSAPWVPSVLAIAGKPRRYNSRFISLFIQRLFVHCLFLYCYCLPFFAWFAFSNCIGRYCEFCLLFLCHCFGIPRIRAWIPQIKRARASGQVMCGKRVVAMVAREWQSPKPIQCFVPNGNNELCLIQIKRPRVTRFLYSFYQSTYILIMRWYIKKV